MSGIWHMLGEVSSKALASLPTLRPTNHAQMVRSGLTGSQTAETTWSPADHGSIPDAYPSALGCGLENEDFSDCASEPCSTCSTATASHGSRPSNSTASYDSAASSPYHYQDSSDLSLLTSTSPSRKQRNSRQQDDEAAGGWSPLVVMQPTCPDSKVEEQDLPGLLGPDGRVGYFTNRQTLRIGCYFWPTTVVPTPRAVLVLVHGHGSHLPFEYLNTSQPGMPPQYCGSWVEVLNQAGFAVCGIDLQGAGRSEGTRCFVHKFEHYVQDVIDFSESMSDVGLEGFTRDVPKFIVGISLGGGIATHVMHETGTSLFRGAVLLAPMLSLDRMSSRGINRVLRVVAQVLDRVVPQLTLVRGSPNVLFPHVQEAFDRDPNCFKYGTRIHNALEYLRACERLQREMHHLDFPFITFHSANDQSTDPQGSLTLYEQSSSRDKTFVHVDSMFHALTKEDGHWDVLAQVMQWINNRV